MFDFIKKNIAIFSIATLLITLGAIVIFRGASTDDGAVKSSSAHQPILEDFSSTNPLAGKSFYTDNSRKLNKLVDEYRKNGNLQDATLIEKVAERPGTTWLVGPNESDPLARSDTDNVRRTSTDASTTGTVPIYQLYAIPGRDACATYSKGGFKTSDEYLAWIDRIISELKTPSVFSVEPDAIVHTINTNCLKADEIEQRYILLKATMQKLSESSNVLGAYLDAGHSEWFPDTNKLYEPLKKSGIEYADGVAVNISFFEETAIITDWSKKLVERFGPKYGVLIDTSRNGKGAPDASAKGEMRWCNPSGRGAGPAPTTQVAEKTVHAYFWGKNIGESDGSCFGYPPAGEFVPSLALEIARNASF